MSTAIDRRSGSLAHSTQPGSGCHIALSLTEGRTIRDLFYNGLLDRLLEAGCSLTVFTEAWRVPDLVDEWGRPGIEFVDLPPCESNGWRSRGFRLRRRLARLGKPALLRPYLAAERRILFPAKPYYLEQLRRLRPALVLLTHCHSVRESELASAAHACGIPTLGLVRSWDNVCKGLHTRPQQVTVWNNINRDEVLQLEGYRPEEVHLVGAPQFDPYYASATAWTRDRLAQRFGLDPARPIFLFASLGNFFVELDETCWMRSLLELIDRGEVPGRPQVICRLHPWSRFEQFKRFANHPAVRLSYVDRYIPGLQWYMTREDVVEVGNLLRHADLVITPASTITLEGAIFDRPTMVTVFHPYQPERGTNYFNTWAFGKHFRRIQELDLVPIIRRQEDFAPAIVRSLKDPGWYREQRKRLVEEYVHFTDGRSTERIAQLCLSLVQRTKA